jgi:hypothetical protein
VKNDTSKRFAIMSTVKYERAGKVYIVKDVEVDLAFLQENKNASTAKSVCYARSSR